MKILLVVLILTAELASAQQASAPSYAMDNYYVGLLKKGPKWTKDVSPETTKIQEGHMANIRRMDTTGKLIVADPFTDDGDLRGMFIFKVASLEAAEAMVAPDPAIQSGRLVLELHPWFAAKGLAVPVPAK